MLWHFWEMRLSAVLESGVSGNLTLPDSEHAMVMSNFSFKKARWKSETFSAIKVLSLYSVMINCSYLCYWLSRDDAIVWRWTVGACRCGDPVCWIRVICWSSGLLQFTHQLLLYLSLSCSCAECCLSQWSCVCVVLGWRLYHSFLCLWSLLLLFLSCLFLSSVHIGGPQNAVCSFAGYLSY